MNAYDGLKYLIDMLLHFDHVWSSMESEIISSVDDHIQPKIVPTIKENFYLVFWGISLSICHSMRDEDG